MWFELFCVAFGKKGIQEFLVMFTILYIIFFFDEKLKFIAKEGDTKEHKRDKVSRNSGKH